MVLDCYLASYEAAVIRGQATTASPASQDIPIWGPLFSSHQSGDMTPRVQRRITNLTGYIETLRAKIIPASGFGHMPEA